MITQVQILPSIYHLQRQGIVGDISICALNVQPLKNLTENEMLKKAFPGQSFTAYPSLDKSADDNFPELFKEVIANLPEYSIVVVAMPDQLHYAVIKEALANDQHILSVKPLVLEYQQATDIENEAYEKGLVIGIEYHKRLDNRALIARRQCRGG